MDESEEEKPNQSGVCGTIVMVQHLYSFLMNETINQRHFVKIETLKIHYVRCNYIKCY